MRKETSWKNNINIKFVKIIMSMIVDLAYLCTFTGVS